MEFLFSKKYQTNNCYCCKYQIEISVRYLWFLWWCFSALIFLFLFLLLLDRFFVNDLLFEIWRFDIEKVLIASMGSLAIVMVFTFVSNKFWTFKKQEIDVRTKPFIHFLQFILVGLTGFALYSGIVYILATLLHSNEYLATTIAFFVGGVNNFIWNDLWTFNPKTKIRKEEKSLEEL